MRLLKIDVESDLRMPGQGRPEVRNEISLIETDEGYEVETVYSIDASDYRDRNTNEFYSDVIDLGSKEEIDRDYFKPSKIQSDTNNLEQRDIKVEYCPEMENSRWTIHDSHNPNSTSKSQFTRDLLELDEERIFADVIYEQIDHLPIHKKNQDPVSPEEFELWINQLSRQYYSPLVESMNESNQIFEETIAGRKRDFKDSLKSTFSQVSEELSETYDESPSQEELYELFTEVRGLKPVSDYDITDYEYSSLTGQSMESFVLGKRKETAFQEEDRERMRPNEDYQNSNAYIVDSGPAETSADRSNNFIESNGLRLIEGVFTVDDGGKLEDFLRWDIDEWR